ncbi:hypothetical protein PCAR4_640013 [Paraburkholderia caribensis]|nr:hypothetical protein PCAR4_640013 [Paraburkholderia caribensis]
MYARPLAILWTDPGDIWGQGGGSRDAIAAAEAGHKQIPQNENVGTFRRVSGRGVRFQS